MGVTIKVSRSLSFNVLLNFSNVLNVISFWISKKASQLILYIKSAADCDMHEPSRHALEMLS